MADKQETDFPGTSQFTHRDDAVAPFHTSRVDHVEAHLRGEQVPPNKQLKSVVLGPGAYGSPDPTTLNKTQLSGAEEAEKAKAKGDKKTQDRPNIPEGDPSEEWTKDQLFTHAQDQGLKVNQSMTKADLLDAIENPDDYRDEDEGADEETEENS